MKRLVLKQGFSYAAKGFSCVRGIPFDAKDDAARKLLSTGRFEIFQDLGSNDGYMEQEGLSADAIAKLKKPELEALAAEKNIDISDCSNNDERAAKICDALDLAVFTRMGLED